MIYSIREFYLAKYMVIFTSEAYTYAIWMEYSGKMYVISSLIHLDAGYFVVPINMNQSRASECAEVKYHAIYDCNGGSAPFRMDIGKMIYSDVFAYDACINYHHLKEWTKDFDFCVKMLN